MKTIINALLILSFIFSLTLQAGEVVSRELLVSTLWVQNSAEYALLSAHSFNQAEASLSTAKKSTSSAALEKNDLSSINRPPAIMVEKLSLASWNIEWLMTPATYLSLKPGCDKVKQPASNERNFPCTPGRPPIVQRKAKDFDALAGFASQLQADVVALQEVDGPAAGAMVFRQGWKLDCFVSRQHPQKVGFAIRDGIPYRCNPELISLDFDGKSRAGADITIYPDSPNAVRLLSIHLKSGCFTGPLTGGNAVCSTLRKQVVALEKWVDARAAEGVAFALLGDFNRRLEIDSQFPAGNDESAPTSLFAAISDGMPQGAKFTRATEGQIEQKCSPNDRNPPSPIDNILLSEKLFPANKMLNFKRITYTNYQIAKFALSDHCPLQVDFER